MGDRPYISAEQRAEVACFIEDLTVSHEAGWYCLISLHGGGSPEAMKGSLAKLSRHGKGRTDGEPARPWCSGRGRRVSKQPGRCRATGPAESKLSRQPGHLSSPTFISILH
ncbi:hypothetical protein MHY87_15125 [Microvirga sp. ACRRW]|uniref:4-hydroxyphenylacetate 3-hydroxylase C-terminal domain-containing protein n=1 Tax=Microvirga sp. ACRRW TaxID=2918205 RepID=UPI001EF5343A|nr:4-hydroxyphenylacetate 3-hydroxylase C-terminal domain-containing protein [Microvirga sp. ACRRW]MCG7394237.1 hypothetical protein [Microvirga sp. ACRRW]